MLFSDRRFLLLSLLCAILAASLFIPGLSGGFIFDDESNIVNNRAIQMETLDVESIQHVAFGLQPGGITRVLPTVSFAVDYWRNGLDPSTFKATNLVIHAITTIVLAWFFRTLLLLAGLQERRSSIGALLMALGWAIHPLQVSSVLYVVQRMQTLCTLFLLLALWSYLKARKAQLEGASGRKCWLLMIMFWILALGSKEDAILLPAYTLLLEFTILRFASADPEQSRRLRKGYFWMSAVGISAFLLLVVPHYWHATAYQGRDFSTTERLLTQGRVLCMYLWQIFVPLPQNMPFYYDWIQPSRGILQPWSTLPALLLIAGLLIAAWQLRTRRPLLSLGLLLYFSGHFITSNVVGLELAFEHRNHFPMIGIALVVFDLANLASAKLRMHPAASISSCFMMLALLGTSTTIRAKTWGSSLELARKSTEMAPDSARAWNSLCRGYFKLGGEYKPGNPYLGQAIDACTNGANAAPYSISSLTNVLIFKTLQGTTSESDWDRYLARLNTVPMTPENRQTLIILFNNASHGVALDEDGIFKAIEIYAKRETLKSVDYASIGYFILTETRHPDRAYPYFVRAVQTAPPNASLPAEISTELRSRNHDGWARKLETEVANQRKLTN